MGFRSIVRAVCRWLRDSPSRSAPKKRKPLQRKTELKRGGPLKRTAKLNPISKKQRKVLEGIRDARAAYRDKHRHCCICGASPTCVHEITSGSYGRAKGIVEIAVWLPVCAHCNAHVLDDHKLWPKEMQMAVKLEYFADEFDLERANACYIGTFSMDGIEGYLPEVRRRLGERRAA